MADLKTVGKPMRVGDGTPGPGRPKGLPNKATKALKEMILQALDNAGGVEYLQRQANDNPTAFMGLVGKVLPMTVAGDPDNPTTVVHRIELVAPTLRHLPEPEVELIEYSGDRPN